MQSRFRINASCSPHGTYRSVRRPPLASASCAAAGAPVTASTAAPASTAAIKCSLQLDHQQDAPATTTATTFIQRLAVGAAAAAVSLALDPAAAHAALGSSCPNRTSGPGLLQLPISSSELPAARPTAWRYCGWDCAAELSLETRPNGAVVASVTHKPLGGVRPEQLRWWFDGNVEGEMVHPVDGRTYPRYLGALWDCFGVVVAGFILGVVGMDGWVVAATSSLHYGNRATNSTRAPSSRHALAHACFQSGTHGERWCRLAGWLRFSIGTAATASPQFEPIIPPTHPPNQPTNQPTNNCQQRDHIIQSTMSPGRSPGDVTGATWFIEEFFLASKADGWVRGDDACDWADEVGGWGWGGGDGVGVGLRRRVHCFICWSDC